jgi:hypothetical protein
MGTEIAPERKQLFAEELDYKSAVSERSLFKVGAGINFINTRQNNVFDFKFLGPMRTLLGGEDGGRGFIFNSSIVGVSGILRLPGSSGNTVVDIHLIRAGADLGTILSTKLTIPFSTSGIVHFYKNLIDASSYVPSGLTLPVFSVTDFNAGDVLRMDLDTTAIGAFDLTYNLHYRPR